MPEAQHFMTKPKQSQLKFLNKKYRNFSFGISLYFLFILWALIANPRYRAECLLRYKFTF
ncbi:hypothetical protein SAMN05444366_0125 [Flavobacterium saccharophilum]|uniref:Uncharacterized protein n=1 Tax=Flavobacterium saccharophilum TaxID=29534 RepID=A0A1M6Z5C2_9FLAO|nr:hypothetical protein SAMN05444366_0125 [Flavobacterium saccharophilum]